MIHSLPAAEGPEGKITIDKPPSVWPSKKLDKKTGAKKKTPVTFNHKGHGRAQGCQICHHSEPKLKEGDTEAASCFLEECHGPKAVTSAEGKVKPDSYQITHDKKMGICQTCHVHYNKDRERKPRAPSKCQDCHRK
jgi:hypothetical protein